MRERPIIFSAPMVRALIAGTKTVTRRIVKPSVAAIANEGIVGDRLCPYGVKGDRLWVRETHAFGPTVDDPDDWRDNPDDWAVFYRADGDERPWKTSYEEEAEEIAPPWRPSIFMPRWASRITLEVVSVRVERLHSIDDADALREGVHGGSLTSDAEAFAHLWDEINGDRAPWSSNPWVWRVEFTPAAREVGR